jgi:hypothetical protein
MTAQRMTELRPAARENSELRRELARARANSRPPGSRPAPASSERPGRVDRTEWIRIMLSDPCSRNP